MVLIVKEVEQSRWKAEDAWLVFLHFCLVNIPPSVHDDLVLDSMNATLVVSVIDLLVIHGDQIRGNQDAVDDVPDRLAVSTGD